MPLSCSPRAGRDPQPRHYIALGMEPPLPSSSSRSPSPSGPDHMLTLQDICWRTVRTHVNSRNVVQLIHWASSLYLPPDTNLLQHCQSYVAMAYTLLRERLGPEQLATVMDAALMKQLEESVLDRERRQTHVKMALGRVVEPPPPPESACLQQPSVGGHPVSYAYSALVTGVAWPLGVDPSAREAHLCAQEFLQVLGMTYEAYCALPAWRKTVLKQQHKLF